MTVCLSMIVKNEAHCITKCLESVKPYIDYWIISDTGSTDNTIEIIKNVLKDIPGEIHQNKWEDFSTNRNIALDLSKDKADYILFIDADDYLVVEDKSCFKKLKHTAYGVKIKQDPIEYERTCLISSKIDSKYEGVLHECLVTPPNIVPILLKGCYIQFGAIGSRSKDPQKYIKDAEVFEKALIKEPNNARYVFYCAQSYRDAGNLIKAAEFYAKRTGMNGWLEETGYAAFEWAKMLESISPNDVGNILSVYSKACNLIPHRAEPFLHASNFLRKVKMFEVAYFYSKIGSRILKPISGLFVQSDCYDWRIKDELAICAFYIGKYNEAIKLNNELLNSDSTPIQERDRITNNLIHCKKKL